MRRDLQRLAAVASLAISGLMLPSFALAPAQSAPARPASSAPLGGVSIDGLSYGTVPAQAGQEVAAASELNAKLVRVEVPWSVMEPRGPGQLEPSALAFTDRLAADAAAAGMRVIMMVDSTPCWASSAPASLLRKCSPTRDSAANAWPPSEPSAYASFLATLAQRYGSQLAAIEVWNEPDQANEYYFAGPDKAARYAALLRAAYPAIKRANPSVLVLGGAFVGDNGKFLRALYAAGIKGYYDGLAVHFYTLSVAALRYTHEVQLANGDSTPLWLDEFGFSSCWPREKVQQDQGCVTARLQAVDLTDLFRSLAHVPYVAAMVVYSLNNSANEDFGVLTASGARKPAFSALARVLASPFGEPSPVTLRLHRSGKHVLARGSGPPGDYLQLEAFQGSVPRYRSLFVLDRFNEYSIALPSVLGTSGLTVRVSQYGQGSARAAQQSI
jgi:polysaccharide biosynthesis protein PslG